MKRSIVCLPLLAAVAGCASIVKGGAQDIAISSNVPEAKFEIRNNRTNAVQLTGATPASIKLDRGAGYFKSADYTITISKDGYVPQSIPVKATVNGWYAGGNLLIGGLIGYLAVDPATGAMWTLHPETIASNLVAVTPPPVVEVVPEPAVQPPLAAPEAVPVAMAPAQPSPPLALVAGGQARLLGVARTRALPEGDPVAGLPAGASVTLKAAVRNASGEWWYVNGATGSGWVLAAELEPVAVAGT